MSGAMTLLVDRRGGELSLIPISLLGSTNYYNTSWKAN